MKTKRILAAILSALMLMSCMSFTAGATEEPVDGEISLFDFLGEEGMVAIEEAEEAVDEPEEVVDEVEETVDEPEEAVDEVEETVDEPEEAVDEVEETVDEPEEAVDEVEETVEESEEPSEKSTKKTSKKVEAEEEASLMAEAVEETNKVYLSDSGNDENDGLTAETPVLNLAKANELLAANGKDTLVIVGTYTICKDQEKSYGKVDIIGVAGKTITIEGNTADAVFCMDRSYNAWDDAKTSMAGHVIIKNLTLQGENNDGYLATNGHDLVIESSVKAGSKVSRIVPGANVTNNVVLKGGYHRFNVGGTSNSVVKNNTTLTVDGAKMLLIGLGKGNYGTAGHNGRFDVVIENGEVTNITMNSDGTGAANSYNGVRYYVLNGGKVYGITTTGSASRLNNATEKAEVAVGIRKGVTVFEINKAGVLNGNINLGQNKFDTTKYDVDDATRIILFNNDSYASFTGNNADKTAITVNVVGGALQADVTMEADYTATLEGYTYETTEPYIRIENASGESFYVSSAAPDGERAAQIPAEEATLAEESETVYTGIIPAEYLTNGFNTVTFGTAEAAVKFVVDGVAKYEYQTVGTPVQFPASDKVGHSYKWSTTEGGESIEIANETVAYEGNTYYATGYTINQYTITFDTDGGSEIAPITQDYGTDVTAPTDVPTKPGYDFVGWDNIPAKIPAENVTVKALWTLKIEDETAVYISDKGNDTYPGRHSDFPVKTLAKALEILKELDNADKLVVVEYFTIVHNNTFGIKERPITITGKTKEAIFSLNDPSLNDEILSLTGDIIFKDITLVGSTNDGRIEGKGYNITIDENVSYYKPAGISSTVALTTGGNYGGTIKVMSGTIARIYPGHLNNTHQYKAVNVIVGGTANVSNFTLGHNYRNITNYFGVVYAEINGGTINNLWVDADGAGCISNYSGLRYYTINGGTVNNIQTYGMETRTNGSKTQTATKQEGVTVFEINGGTINSIKPAESSVDKTTRVIIFNNDTYKESLATDTGAVMIKVVGGTLKADVTTDVPGDKAATATLNGYTFTKANEAHNRVTITPAGGTAKTYDLSETTFIPATDLAAGVNTVEFFTYVAPTTADYTIETYTMGLDGGYGAPATETKTATIGDKVNCLAEEKTGFTVSDDSVLTGTVTADGGLVLRVYYIRNQYKLYTKADAEAEAVEAGTYYYDAPVSAPATPTKTGHTFKAWDAEIPATMPANDVTVTAQWTINEYNVTFKNGEEVLQTGKVAYGETPVYSGETPTKAATAQYTYTFAGWDKEIVAVAGNATYTATYTETKNSYTITWINGDAVVKTVTAVWGTPVEAPAVPTKTGYTFDGWDKAVSEIPAENVTVNAKWTINKYTITFNTDGGSEVDAITADFGTAVTAPTAPTKTGYAFIGWDVEIPATMPAENMTITAMWEAQNVQITVNVYEMDTEGNYPATPETIKADGIADEAVVYNVVPVGFTLDTTKSTSLENKTVAPDGSTAIDVYYKRNVIKIVYTIEVGNESIKIEEIVDKADHIEDIEIDAEHHYEVEITLPELDEEVLEHLFEEQHKDESVPENVAKKEKGRKNHKFYWKKNDKPSGHLLEEERNEALDEKIYFLPGDTFNVPEDHVEFTAHWDYSGAELVLSPNASKAVANDHEFVFDIYLESAYSETLTKFESGEFTLDITTKNNTSYTYELTPNANITFEPDLDGRILVKRTDGNAAYLVPEKAPNGTDYRIYLGAVKVTGAGEGTVTLSKAVGYRHVVDGTDADHLAVEFLVKDASESYTVEVPTATLKVTVDFKNIVTDNVHEYQDMTMTISGGDLGEEIVIDLGKNASFAVPDLANRDGEAITAPALADGKYVVTLTNILAVNRTYNIKLEGAGYRSTRYTVSMTADKELYFWNNVMDNVTEIETGKPGTQVTFLAGDIVKDSEINIYDLSAVVSYFGEIDLNKAGTQSAYTKYDLNRDGKIDSKDVAYVLVSWGK